MIQDTTSLQTLEIFDRCNVKEDNNGINSAECEMDIIISEVHGNAIDKYFGLNEESKDPMLNDVNTYNVFKENFESMNVEELHLTNPEYQFNLKALNINQEPFDIHNEALPDFHTSPNEDCSRLVENEKQDTHYDNIDIIDEFAKITEESFYPNESEK